MLTQFYKGTFPETHETTVEDLYQTRVRVNSEVVNIKVLDTGGLIDYDSYRPQWCQTGQAFIIAFSATSRRSFNGVQQFTDEIAKWTTKCPLALVATNADLNPEVSIQEGRRRAKELGAQYFHISVKDYHQAQQPFQHLARQMLHPGARHAQLLMEVRSGGAITSAKDVGTPMRERKWARFISTFCIGHSYFKDY